jgi:mannitol-1-/sugar-/sorbitol-6-phosphatase
VELTAEAILLDLDGTLIDSTPAIVRSWLTWAGEYQVDPQHLRGAHGRPTAEIVASLVPASDVEAAVARLDRMELEDVTDIRALPGAIELMEALPPGRWAVVTSCGAALAAARMAAAGLPTVSHLVTVDDVSRGKPDPEPYLAGAAKLGFRPDQCVVLEDAPSGIAAARAAGMQVVAVTTTHPAAELDADLVAGTPADLQIDSAGPLNVRLRHGRADR